MSLYTVQPITDFTIFTTPPADRKPVKFKAPWATTVKELKRELHYLDAHDVVMEIGVDAKHIRLDGQLRADARPTHPGVRLTFQSTEHGSLSYTCDTYEARWTHQIPDWQSNVRAIVLTLEALRSVDRYGATQGEQYAGFKALGAGTGAVPFGGMTPQVALLELTDLAQGAGATAGFTPAQLYRRARARCHPDRHQGDRSLWDRVEQAAKVLGLSS